MCVYVCVCVCMCVCVCVCVCVCLYLRMYALKHLKHTSYPLLRLKDGVRHDIKLVLGDDVTRIVLDRA